MRNFYAPLNPKTFSACYVLLSRFAFTFILLSAMLFSLALPQKASAQIATNITVTGATGSFDGHIYNGVATDKAQVTINVTTDAGSSVSGNGSVNLSYGLNYFTVVVTNADLNSSNSYYLTIEDFSANLSGISLSNGTLSPSFSPGTHSYIATVPSTVKGITITGVSPDGAGSTNLANTAIPLNVGDNIIALNATSAVGNAVGNTYNIDVTALPPAPAISYTNPAPYIVGGAISTLGPQSSNVAGQGYNGATIVGSGFNVPLQLATDAAGNIYVPDYFNGAIKEIPAGGGAPVTLASGYSQLGGIAVDAVGNVYFGNNHNVNEIPVNTGTVTTLATNLTTVSGLAVDAAGNIYVSDLGNHCLVALYGSLGSYQYNKLYQWPSSASLTGVAVDGAGNIYVSDFNNNAIYMFAGGGGSPVTIGNVMQAEAVAVDAAGNVYAAGYLQNIVMRPAGGSAFNVFGVVANTRGLAADQFGNVYYSEDLGSTVNWMKPFGGFYLGTPLPAGLSFDQNTGNISGTPTAAAALKNYQVSAWNAAGRYTTQVSLQVDGSAPPVISYNSPNTYLAGNSISPLTPATTNVSSMAYSGAYSRVGLPAGTTPGVAVDAAGDCYVTNTATQALYKVAAGSTIPVQIQGGFSSPFSLAIDAAGNLFVADQSLNTIVEIAAGTNVPITVASGFSFLQNIAVDAAGNLYAIDDGTYTVLKLPFLNPGVYGNPVTLYQGAASKRLYGLAVDASGNVYAGGFDDGVVYELPGGTGTAVAIGGGHSFAAPYSLWVDAAQNLFIGCYDSFAYKYLPASGTITNLPSLISGLFALTTDPGGNVYFAGNGGIQKVSPSGGCFINAPLPAGLSFDTNTGNISGTPVNGTQPQNYTVTAWNSGGSGQTSFSLQVLAAALPTLSYQSPHQFLSGTAATPLAPSDGGTGSPRTYMPGVVNIGPGFFNPAGVALDAAGDIFVTEAQSNTLQEIPAGTNTPKVIASGFNAPAGVAVDAMGNSYVAGGFGNAVYEVPAGTGTVVTLVPNVAHPDNIAVDASFNVYYTEAATNTVWKLPPAGVPVAIGTGFNYPTGVSVDAAGNVYVADQNNNAVKEIKASDGSTVGIGSGFSTPSAVSVDAAGNVYVCDAGNFAIKVIPADGSAVYQISNAPQCYRNLQVGLDGTVYVPDCTTGQVAAILPAGGYFINKMPSAGLTFNTDNGTVSGTPSALAAAADYSIATWNNGGKTTATVNIAVIANAQLASLALNSGTLSPAFNGSVFNYTASVNYPVTTITVTPTLSDPNATVTVNGIATTPGSASSPISLSTGTNNISIVVTGRDGTTSQTYTVTVTRLLAANASLVSMNPQYAPLSPSFATNTTSYTISVSNSKATMTVAPVTSDPNATIKVNGTSLASGTTSSPIPLAEGAVTPINVVVTAQNGTTTKTYTISVTRAASSVGTLSGIGLSAGTITPAFSSTTTGYSAAVDNTVSGITVTAVATDANAVIKVNGITVASGVASGPIALAEGATTNITVAVTSQDGSSSKTYTIAVSRAASSNASLSAINPQYGPLSPVFYTNTINYTESLANSKATMTVSPVASDANATIRVNGMAVASGATSQSIALSEGANTAISIIVTAQDGTTSKTYTINVARAPSATATLASLVLSSGILSPTFVSTTAGYTASVDNSVSAVTVSPLASDPNATIKVNGNTVMSGTASAPIALAEGLKTTITVVVLAQDGTTTKTYTVGVTRAPSGNAGLSAMNPQYGPLSPVFSTNTTSYTETVANSKTTMTVAPVTSDPNATIKVNGIALASGSTSSPVALTEGIATAINVVVTAQDGITTKTYTVNVTRAPSSVSTLSALAPSAGTLSPAFASATTVYTVGVDNSTGSVKITPTATDAHATVKVNGSVVLSGAASGSITLPEGVKTNISVLVTSQDGTTTKTYSIGVTRAPSSNAGLSVMNPQYTPLSPVFNTNTTSYTESVANSKATMTVAPVSSDANATIKVNGVTLASGTTSAPIPLAEGAATTIAVAVTAQDGVTTKTYTIVVIRAPSAVSTLAALNLSTGSLSPAFATTTTSYTCNELNGVSGITVTPIGTDVNENIKINGITVASGNASGLISLPEGATTNITVVVTSQDGTTTKTYSLAVYRAPSADATLASLATGVGAVTPTFSPNTTGYAQSVSNAKTSVTVIPVANDANAAIKVNGVVVVSGTASGAISLAEGVTTTITVSVLAQDGVSTKTYTIGVTRAPSADASLSAMNPQYGPLSPVFSTNTTSYTETVGNSKTSMTVAPVTTDANATITVNGTALTSGATSAPIALGVGSNKITVIVTAQDGVTARTYSIMVTRAATGADAYGPVSVTQPVNMVTIAGDDLKVHQGVSPNGDGIEDFLQIDNISRYPDNKLLIMNRNGQLVYEAKGYDNLNKVFDGRSNKTGQMQLPGTYFYQLDYTVAGIVKHKTGFIVLKY